MEKSKVVALCGLHMTDRAKDVDEVDFLHYLASSISVYLNSKSMVSCGIEGGNIIFENFPELLVKLYIVKAENIFCLFYFIFKKIIHHCYIKSLKFRQL